MTRNIILCLQALKTTRQYNLINQFLAISKKRNKL